MVKQVTVVSVQFILVIVLLQEVVIMVKLTIGWLELKLIPLLLLKNQLFKLLVKLNGEKTLLLDFLILQLMLMVLSGVSKVVNLIRELQAYGLCKAVLILNTLLFVLMELLIFLILVVNYINGLVHHGHNLLVQIS